MIYKDGNEYTREDIARGHSVLKMCSGLTKKQLMYNDDYLRNKIKMTNDQVLVFNSCIELIESHINHDFTTGLMIIGPVWCGKTMFASYIISLLVDNYTPLGEFVAYSHLSPPTNHFSYIVDKHGKLMISVPELFSHLKNCLDSERSWDYKEIISELKKVDLLILDDLGAEKPSEWTRSIIFEIIDYRYNMMLPIVVTTNCLPEELKEKIGDRNVDRLREMCKLVTINHSSFRKTAE